jgi:hypothetical protein
MTANLHCLPGHIRRLIQAAGDVRAATTARPMVSVYGKRVGGLGETAASSTITVLTPFVSMRSSKGPKPGRSSIRSDPDTAASFNHSITSIPAPSICLDRGPLAPLGVLSAPTFAADEVLK